MQDHTNDEIEQVKQVKSGWTIKPITILAIILVTILISAFTTNYLINNKVALNNYSSAKEDRQEFQKLYEAYDRIAVEYFKDIDTNELINGAIDGMLESLDDPYTDYLSIEEAVNFNSTISSSFEGIGAEVSSVDGNITIVSPINGSPAKKAGIKANDVILTVDGTSVTGMSVSEAVSLIRGPKETEVILTIKRPGMEEILTIPIVRDTIPIETVYGEILPNTDGIAKVQVTSFSQNTVNELKEKLTELEKDGMKSLILDLRHNPGGLLDQALELASLFMDNDKTVLFVENRDGSKYNYVSSGQKKEIDLVVLVDEGSASASEIVAAALSESANVPLVGKTTFGKGTVQRAFDFSDGSTMKFTIQKWLTPNGNWIHGEGIKPDYEVSLPDYASLTVISVDATYKLDNYDPQIKVAQNMLNALGYTVREDGYFDSKMEEKIKQFQSDNNITVDGILTGETSTTLMERLGQLILTNDTQVQKAVEILSK